MGEPGTTVLLTGIGLDGGPDIIRALRADGDLGARVVGVDASPDHASRHLCDAFELVPLRDDPGYVEAVEAVAVAEGAKLIYPLPTFDQEIFAAASGELGGRGIAVAASPVEAIRVCNDKLDLYERLRPGFGELIPRTERVTTAEELRATAGAFGYPGSKVCIRRRVSRGAIGLRILDAGPDRVAGLLERNPGSLQVSLDEVLDTLEQTSVFPEYLVQEYLPGPEWDVDVLCREGEAVALATRRSIGMDGGAATRCTLEANEALAAHARAIVAEVGLDTVVNIAFRDDGEANPKLLEINPRIPQSILTALGGGLNLVALSVRQALGQRIEHAEAKPGGEFVRHFSSVVTDPDGKPVIGAR